ncbi:MAG: HEAT repeat domain-containing protein [Planctomycetota bacterium]
MSRVTTASAWKVLLSGLTNSDSFVRCESSRLLGLLGDRRAVKPLTKLLTSERHTTKVTAVYALGQIGDRRAAPILRQIATDPGVFRFPGMHNHDMIRLAAALELAKWKDSSGLVAVNDLMRLRGMEAMLQLGPAILAAPRNAATKPLKAYVSLKFLLPYHHGRLTASNHFFLAQCLAYFSEPAARKQLVEYLTHFSRYVRPEAAASLLMQDASDKNLRLVARHAKKERTPFGRIRFSAILQQHGIGDATAAIASGLRNKDAFVRATAIDAAAKLKLTSLAPTVTKLLADTDFYVRICAAEALESLAPRSAAKALAPLLADSHPRVAVQAAKSFLVCSR